MNRQEFAHIFPYNEEVVWLQKRDDIIGIFDPGMIGAIGGHREPEDDTLLMTAQRELEEETNIFVPESALCFGGLIVARKRIAPDGRLVTKYVKSYTLSVPNDLVVSCYDGQGAVPIRRGDELPDNVTDITKKELGKLFPNWFGSVS